jgi:hypothetical protein
MSLIRLTLVAAAAALLPAAAHAQQPQPAPARDSAVVTPAGAAADTLKAVDEPLVLAGFYALDAVRGITVTLENDVLYGAPSTGEKRQLLHKYGTTYNVEGTQMLLTFNLDANGLPTEMVMKQNGQQRILKKSAK